MTIFSTQRYTRFFRSTTALFCGLAISSLLGLSAHAQSKDELFRGTWQIDTPEKGTLIMIVKSQSQASYFWGDNTDRTVYAGTWVSEGETATLTWADGSQHRIKGDSLGFAITHIDASGRERLHDQSTTSARRNTRSVGEATHYRKRESPPPVIEPKASSVSGKSAKTKRTQNIYSSSPTAPQRRTLVAKTASADLGPNKVASFTLLGIAVTIRFSARTSANLFTRWWSQVSSSKMTTL